MPALTLIRRAVAAEDGDPVVAKFSPLHIREILNIHAGVTYSSPGELERRGPMLGILGVCSDAGLIPRGGLADSRLTRE